MLGRSREFSPAKRETRSSGAYGRSAHAGFRLRRSRMISQSRHSAGAVRTKRSAWALARGARKGVRLTPDAFAPEDPIEGRAELRARSWIKNLTSPRGAETLRLRAC